MVTAFGKLGLPGDFGGTWLLTQLVGPARARELYFTSRRIDAVECERIGLVNRVVAADVLRNEAMTLARQLAAGPPIAFRWMKDNLNRALHSDLRKQIDYANSPEVVSTDFVGSRHACVFDAQATIVNGKQAVLYLWYDNEFGYSCQVHRILEQMSGLDFAVYPKEA